MCVTSMLKEGITMGEKGKADERSRMLRGAMKSVTKDMGDIIEEDAICEDETTRGRRPDSEDTSCISAMH